MDSRIEISSMLNFAFVFCSIENNHLHFFGTLIICIWPKTCVSCMGSETLDHMVALGASDRSIVIFYLRKNQKQMPEPAENKRTINVNSI